MKAKKILILTLLSILMIPSIAYALNFEVGKEIYNTETINDDYYAAGGVIQMESNINGDLTLAGGRILVNSVISQDLILAGGEITVRGEVGDDARIGGGNLTIDTIVKDDLITGGGNIELTDKSFVGGNFVFGGGNVFINGLVNGNIIGLGGNIYINNVITGDVKLYNADNVRIGPKGKVLGNFSYRSAQESPTVNSNTVKGLIEYKPIKISVADKDAQNYFRAVMAGFSVFRLLALLFVGLFVAWIFRFYVNNIVHIAYKNSLKSFGVGLLIAIVTPIAALVALVTGIGISLAWILGLLWLLTLALGKIIAVSIVGKKIIPLKEKSSFLRTYGSFALGALIFVLITLVPFIGWVIQFILIMIGAGALILYEKKLYYLLMKEKKA